MYDPPHATFTVVFCVYMMSPLVLVSQITETEALGSYFPELNRSESHNSDPGSLIPQCPSALSCYTILLVSDAIDNQILPDFRIPNQSNLESQSHVVLFAYLFVLDRRVLSGMTIVDI